MSKKALIAMSGGVDSSVAAYLAKQQGYDCIGVTMKLFDKTAALPSPAGDDIGDARSVAKMLGIPHQVVDLSKDFEQQVISRFVETYCSGATPNPCVDCNRYIKFGQLFARAKELGADFIVTGHYARVEYDPPLARYLLKKGKDASKDQSYVLYSLGQEQLRRTMLPLGELTKADIRAIAADKGFINADKQDSQDICFVPDGDYAGFIERYTGQVEEGGDFVDIDGNALGRHKGQIRYTVGQRKGLGLSFPVPMYVHSKDVDKNTVTLCEDKGLFSWMLEAEGFNWIACDGFDAMGSPLRVKVKVRYRHAEQWATAAPSDFGRVRIEFDEPQRAITKGQAVVLYDGDVVVGGGTIT